MAQIPFLQTLAQYLLDAESRRCSGERVKLPPLADLAADLGVSRGKLREELIAAQAYGLVEMRPGDGTYVNPLDFYTAIRPAVLFGIACDRETFLHIRELRAQLEVTYWDAAVRALTRADLQALREIVQSAERKLQSRPIEIPHAEHRELHLRIFERLDNPLVVGLLHAYWDAYEAVELQLYFDYSYFTEMWTRHKALVEALEAGDPRAGKEVLIAHFELLENRLQADA